MIKLLAKFVRHIRSRNMCKCDSPYYIVIDKKLYCKGCMKPVKWQGGEYGKG